MTEWFKMWKLAMLRLPALQMKKFLPMLQNHITKLFVEKSMQHLTTKVHSLETSKHSGDFAYNIPATHLLQAKLADF